jgi:hypothetical protein
MTSLTKMMTPDPEQEMGQRELQGGCQRQQRGAKKWGEKISQENYQQQSGQEVQDGKRRDLGGDFPGKMPQKPSEMDRDIHVPLLSHKRGMLGQGLQIQQDARSGVRGPTKREEGVFGLYEMLQEEVLSL